jgi:cytoskeletal protein CcmA (bactofilin family)
MATAIPAIEPTVAAGNLDSSRITVEPSAGATSQLSSAVRIEGDIYAQQDLFMDGEVNGNVTVPNHKLSIGPNATVKANIKAKSVVLIGSLEGNIEASERIELRGKSSLLGGIRSPRIQVETGAFIQGAIEVIR